LQGHDGDVVRTVAGAAVGEGLTQAFGVWVGAPGGHLGQGGQALVDVVRAVFDEAVGEEDQGGSAW
jgi:hypothetical protein